eukprot:SAG11_NODE_547_length_8604_cov_4.710641_2_plen_435_part_00
MPPAGPGWRAADGSQRVGETLPDLSSSPAQTRSSRRLGRASSQRTPTEFGGERGAVSVAQVMSRSTLFTPELDVPGSPSLVATTSVATSETQSPLAEAIQAADTFLQKLHGLTPIWDVNRADFVPLTSCRLISDTSMALQRNSAYLTSNGFPTNKLEGKEVQFTTFDGREVKFVVPPARSMLVTTGPRDNTTPGVNVGMPRELMPSDAFTALNYFDRNLPIEYHAHLVAPQTRIHSESGQRRGSAKPWVVGRRPGMRNWGQAKRNASDRALAFMHRTMGAVRGVTVPAFGVQDEGRKQLPFLYVAGEHAGATVQAVRGTIVPSSVQRDCVAYAVDEIFSANKMEFKGSALESLTTELNSSLEVPDLKYFWADCMAVGAVTQTWYKNTIRHLGEMDFPREHSRAIFPPTRQVTDVLKQGLDEAPPTFPQPLLTSP